MRYGLLVVGLLVVLAGCSLGGGGPEPPAGDSVQYNVTNLGDADATTELYVANGSVDALELRYGNGTTRTIAPPYVGDPGDSRSAILALRNVSTVSAPGATVQGLIETAPGESTTGEFAAGEGATVVMVARVDGSAVAAGILQCGTGERMAQVAFDIGGYGPAIGGSCGGG